MAGSSGLEVRLPDGVAIQGASVEDVATLLWLFCWRDPALRLSALRDSMLLQETVIRPWSHPFRYQVRVHFAVPARARSTASDRGY